MSTSPLQSDSSDKIVSTDRSGTPVNPVAVNPFDFVPIACDTTLQAKFDSHILSVISGCLSSTRIRWNPRHQIKRNDFYSSSNPQDTFISFLSNLWYEIATILPTDFSIRPSKSLLLQAPKYLDDSDIDSDDDVNESLCPFPLELYSKIFLSAIDEFLDQLLSISTIEKSNWAILIPLVRHLSWISPKTKMDYIIEMQKLHPLVLFDNSISTDSEYFVGSELAFRSSSSDEEDDT